jgi:hypothetical protein
MTASRVVCGGLAVALASLALAGCGGSNLPASTTSSSDKAPPSVATATDEPKASETKSNEPVAVATSELKPTTPAETKDASAKPVYGPEKPTVKTASIRNITFDTVKFDIQKDEPFKRSKLTKAIEDLDGQRVRIRGYLLPSFQQTGITQFVLVRDNMECCFGPGAAIYDCVVVEMLPGRSTDYTVRPVAVDGKFTLREFLDGDGVVRAIYHLDGEAVK